VARRALDSVRLPLGELSFVIVLMAVGALGKRQLLLEVAFEVARFAFHRLVFAHQRILGLGMVEVVVQTGVRYALPAARVMARGATLVLEAALVWIGVAVVALTERQASVSRGAACVRSVALFALHLLVQAGQRVTCLVVIELPFCIFPVDKVVALQAILPKAAIVKVLVARRAGLRNSQEGLTEILDLDIRPFGSGNAIG